MKKYLMTGILLFITIFMVACSKPMPTEYSLETNILAENIDNSTVQVLFGDKAKTKIYVALENNEPYTVSLKENYVPQNSKVEISDNIIIIESHTEGTEQIPFVVSAKGYDTTEYILNVVSKKKTMEVNYTCNLIENRVEKVSEDSYNILIDTDDTEFIFTNTANIPLNFSLDGDTFEFTNTDNTVKLKAVKPGKSVLKITAQDKNYEDYNKELNLNCFLPRLTGNIEYSNNKVDDVERDTVLTITPKFVEKNTTVNVDTDSEVKVTKKSNGAIELISSKVGKHSVKVTVSADGYSDYEDNFEMNVIPTKAKLSLSKKECILPMGETETVNVVSQENGTVTVQSDNENVQATYTNGKISIAPQAVGKANITVTVKADGYFDNTVTIPVVIANSVKDLNLDNNKLSVALGKTSTVIVTDYTEGDIFYFETNGNVTVKNEKEKVNITLNSGNSATVTVSVLRNGTDIYKGKITITKKLDTVSTNSKYQQVLEECNKNRSYEGLKPLVYRNDIQKIADVRAREIVGLFDHARPGNKTWDSVFAENGKKYYILVGENLAMGSRNSSGESLGDPRVLVDAWMGSPSHRANIMHRQFTGMAVSCYQENGTYYWAQMFIVD